MSQSYFVAHIRRQGVDMILVPLDPIFGSRTAADQKAITANLQQAAIAKKLAGSVVPCWPVGNSWKFQAPPRLAPFLQSLTWDTVLRSRNERLLCG